jgi:hypothetical protein
MFRIVCFCDDRKVGDVLRRLSGLIQGMPEVVPVVNAEKKGKQIKQVTNGNSLEIFAQYLKQNNIMEVNSSVAREFCQSIGRAPSSYSYLLHKAVEEGMLRKSGKGTKSKYTVKT